MTDTHKHHIYNHKDWLVWEQQSSPMLLTLTFNSMMQDLKDYIGVPWPVTIVIYEGEQARWLNRWQDLRSFGQKMIDFLMCPPYRVSFLTAFDNAEEELLRRAKELQFATDLQQQGDGQLIQLFDDLCQCYYSWYGYGWFCEPVTFCVQHLPNGPTLFADAVEALIKDGRLSVDVQTATRALLTPDEDTFRREIDEHLCTCAVALDRFLRISAKARGVVSGAIVTEAAETALHEGLVVGRRLGSPRDTAKALLRELETGSNGGPGAALLRRLEEHAQRFYWKLNNYFSTILIGKLDVLAELLSLQDFVSGFEGRGLASLMTGQLAESLAHKQQMLALKHEVLAALPSYDRSLAVLGSSIGGALQDRRKRAILIANAAFDRILNEVARRTETSVEECRRLIPQELGEFLAAPQRYAQRLTTRRDCFLVYQGEFSLVDEQVAEATGNRNPTDLKYPDIAMPCPFVAEGDAARRFLDQLNGRLNFFLDVEAGAEEVLQGVVAFADPQLPKVTGRIKVIRDPKVETLEEGEILVAPSTSPDYLGTVRRCRAIVTDWGGQTSHAAIVSRELKKPCIIGTNFASQVLSDGDIVTLDFGRGTIVKLPAERK